jgi:uncharacterized membrane protein
MTQASAAPHWERLGENGNGASRDGGSEQLANALGWFSIGLGLMELAAPSQTARLIGIDDSKTNRAILRAFGARELAAGVGILSTRRRPAGWMWARVAGDALDLAALGTALNSDESDKRRLGGAIAAVAGVTALDVLTSTRLSRETRAERFEFERAITVNRPPDEVYSFWRELSNLPRFMRHLESVQVLDGARSHWRAKAPAGRSVEWDAEITEDRPNELIAWRSLPGADVDNSGVVRFRPAPGGRGTEVHVLMHYDPPAGALGAIVAKLFGENPTQQVSDDLRAFKQVIETGEVVLSDAWVRPGRFKPHPAQPDPDLWRGSPNDVTRR